MFTIPWKAARARMTNILPGEFAEQLKVGFENQKRGYFTAREAARIWGHGYKFYLRELEHLGYLEKRPLGKRANPVLRITSKGKKYGQEVLRNKTAREPYSFRWKLCAIQECRKILEVPK
jgi:hypothetical protein